MFNPTNLFSQLNNPSSLGLFAIKDSVDNVSRIGMAYYEGYKGKTPESIESGKHEARERFIDEYGASIAWLGGVPLFRKIYKSAVFKLAKIDPDIHLKKILLDKGKQAFNELDKDSFGNKLIDKAVKSKYKTHHIGMVLFSTVLPCLGISYILPKFNKGITEAILGDKKQKKALKNQSQDTLQLSKNAEVTFASFNKNKDQLKFKGGLTDIVVKTAQSSQHSPTNSMIALDLGISGGRIFSYARTLQERYETALKEAGIVFFFYYATDFFKKRIEQFADKKGLPIQLDSKVLEDKDLIKHIMDSKEIGINNKLTDNLPKFDPLTFADPKKLNEAEKAKQKELLKDLDNTVIKFIDDNLTNGKFKDGKFTNLGLEAARKTGLIEIEKDKNGKFVRSFNKYVETLDVAHVFENLKTYASKISKTETLEKTEEFLRKTKNAKRAGAVINLAICSISLGFLLPKLQYVFRELMTGSNLFTPVKDHLGAKKLSDSELK